MLGDSKINVADTREAKVYKDDPQVNSINMLRRAYEKNDIKKIQQILNDKKNEVFRAPDVIQYLDDLLRNIRLNVLELKVKPYKTVKLSFLAEELNISPKETK